MLLSDPVVVIQEVVSDKNPLDSRIKTKYIDNLENNNIISVYHHN